MTANDAPTAWIVRTMVAMSALVLVAACGGSTSTGPQIAGAGAHGKRPSPTTSAQLYREFAQCLRAHGGTEPDPTVGADGQPQWAQPPRYQPQAALQACQSIMQQFRPNPQLHLSGPEIQQMQQFSQCMRQHGVPNFPDPKPQTGIPDVQRAGLSLSDPPVQQAYQQCRSLLPASVNRS